MSIHGIPMVNMDVRQAIKYDLELPALFEDQVSHISMSSIYQESG